MSIPRELQTRPSVHQLCAGAFIQTTLRIGEHVSVAPLKSLSVDSQAVFAARYAHEILGAEVHSNGFESLKKQGRESIPVVAIIHRHRINASAEDLERTAQPHLERIRTLLSWLSGELPEPFAMITATKEKTYFRLLPYQSRRRQRLGFGNVGADISDQLFRILKLAETDERFEFALSMFRDALRETNPEFKAARMFSCLEALAYRINDGKGSRSRVRKLLGLGNGVSVRIGSGDDTLEYDRVEVAGRIRDKLFHGAPFIPAKHLNRSAAKAYEYLQSHPRQLGDMLLSDCEIEFARWANGASKGQERTE